MGRRNSTRRSSSWVGLYQDLRDEVIPVGNVPSMMGEDAGKNLLCPLSDDVRLPGYLRSAKDCADAFTGVAVRLPTPPLRLVHVSDTHLQHERLQQSAWGSQADVMVGSWYSEDGLSSASKLSYPSSLTSWQQHCLPDGDVLVHSGDFNRFSASCCVRSLHYEDLLHEIEVFFAALPHPVKIFVAGNHDFCLEEVRTMDIQQRLPSCVYLCDSAFTHKGLRFYGSPFTASRFLATARGFAEPQRRLKKHWDLIPEDTDVLVTHMPPRGILDLASGRLPRKCPALFRLATALLPPSTCSTCGFVHAGRQHWGCPALRDAVLQRVKPTLHLFGHVHESYGTVQRDNTVFSNGAFLLKGRHNVFDYYFDDATVVKQ